MDVRPRPRDNRALHDTPPQYPGLPSNAEYINQLLDELKHLEPQSLPERRTQPQPAGPVVSVTCIFDGSTCLSTPGPPSVRPGTHIHTRLTPMLCRNHSDPTGCMSRIVRPCSAGGTRIGFLLPFRPSLLPLFFFLPPHPTCDGSVIITANVRRSGRASLSPASPNSASLSWKCSSMVRALAR